MTDEEKAIDLTSKSFELEKDRIEWFCSTYKNSRMSEIHTFYNGVLVGLAEGRKEGYEQGKNNERELQCGKKNYEKDIARLEKELAECRKSALKELVEHVEKDQSERQVQTINVIELKATIKDLGVDL